VERGESRVYSLLTDVAHVLAGALAGFLLVDYPVPSAFFSLLYFAYQVAEHLTVVEDDFVGDLREYLVGFTVGLATAFCTHYI